VLVKRMHDFLTNTTRLRGCGRFAAFLLHPNVLLIWTAVHRPRKGVGSSCTGTAAHHLHYVCG
jgi:hypothetical protein